MSQSSNEQSQFDSNDPRLTAYVLDELDAHDRAEIERLLATSAEARAALAEIRETVAELQSTFDAEPITPLEPVLAGGAAVIRSTEAGSGPHAPGGRGRGPLGEAPESSTRRASSHRVILALTGTVLVASLLVAIMSSDRDRQSAGLADAGNVAEGAPLDSLYMDKGFPIVAHGGGTKTENIPLGDMDELALFQNSNGDGTGTDRRVGQMIVQNNTSSPDAGFYLAPQSAPVSGDQLSLLVTPRIIIENQPAGRQPTIPLASIKLGANVRGNAGNSAAPVTLGERHAGKGAAPATENKPALAYRWDASSSSSKLADLDSSHKLAENSARARNSRPERKSSVGQFGRSSSEESGSDVSGPAVAGTTSLSVAPVEAKPAGAQGKGSSPAPPGGLLSSNGKTTTNGVFSDGEGYFGNGAGATVTESNGEGQVLGSLGQVRKMNEAEIATWKARFAAKANKNQPVIEGKEKLFWDSLKEVDESAGVQSPAVSEKLSDVKAWKDLSARRRKWAAVDLAENSAPEVRPRYYYRTSDPTAPSTETYEPIVENDFLAPSVAPLSTFAVDVDTASYSNVRRFLTQGQLPPPDAVRIEELLNYFKYNDPAPQGGKPFSVNLEAAACPWNPGHKLVRIGLKGKEIPRNERPFSNLVFLVDVSGSMKDDNKLPLVKSGLELLVNEMAENDRVAIVTYAGHAGVALESTPGSDRQKILNVIRGLNADGSTNGEAGLQLAYDQAAKNLITSGTNRVILCTDGDFNVGVSDDDQLVQIIGRHAKTGVYLSIFGFGMGNLKDAKLEKLADKGNGHYGYVDGIREAQKVFVEEMTGTLYTIAKDVKVQIEFNPSKVGAYRLIGYENRVMPPQDFRNDAKDAGDIGAGHSVTALYEIIPAGAPTPPKGLKYQAAAAVKAPEPANNSPELLTLSLRYKRPEVIAPPAPGVAAATQQSVQEDYPLAEPTDVSAKTSADFRWSSAVAAFGMILRDSPNRGMADLRMVRELASGATAGIGGPKDDNYQTAEHVRRSEFLQLVDAASKLRGEKPVDDRGDRPQK